jgi:hypothetical protein
LLSKLTNLTEALPVKGRASFLLEQFNSSLKNSLIYLLNACDEVISQPLFSQAAEKLNSLDPEKKFSCKLSILHSDFVAAIEREDLKRIEIIVDKIITDDFLVSEIAFMNLEETDEYYSPLLKDILRKAVPEKVDYYPVSQDEFETMKKTMIEALQIIQKTCPDYYEESQRFISEILLIKADRIRHGSSVDAFGMMFRNFNFRWEHLTDSIDIIIHEIAHLYLYVLNTLDQIVVNATDLHSSPLRVDKRPLIGIYHAAFVLSRVVDVLRETLKKKTLPQSEVSYCKELIERHITEFNMAMGVLNEHAILTPIGQGLLSSAQTLIDPSVEKRHVS